ncbi:MAG TPA: 2Fe-2S iron-sulfur cluster-binding protein [Anaeromyxobacteraceae bacterium]|nr:2Fe-2S iron-sulfur cluster-binding protein [Anaeromyxobacteraceae bacterium]
MAEETKPPAPAAAPPKPPGPPPPKNPGFVTLSIDGREAVVKPGTNLIEAARAVGVNVPYYCYHKRLSIAANCRMCLVEMSNAPGGKLMPACQMTVAEGISVRTDTAKVKDQQRATLEFLLLNHPVDCPICDQSGECKLQDYYMSFDARPSRLEMDKVEMRKRVGLGPLVVLDEERCILCTRCVRFMREVRKNPQLGVEARGNHSFITTVPGKPLDDRYSGNVVDLCPVGALTSADFRFRGRVWFLSSARSVCTGCARGCNTFLDYMRDSTYRYRPRENEDVNQEWMCDQGRLSYKQFNDPRVLAARLGRAPGRRASRAEAVAAAAEALKGHAGQGTLALLASPVASLEDLLVGLFVARDGLRLGEIYVGGRPDGWQDDFLKRADENPNRKGLELVAQAFGLAVKPAAALAAAVESGAVRGVWAIGHELPDPALAARLTRAEALLVQATSEGELSSAATVLLPASAVPESDGTFVNFEGRAQRFEMAYWPRGDSQPHWALAGEVGRALGLTARWRTAREVFEDLGRRVADGLAGFRWDSLPAVDRRRSLVPLAAGTVDGRLPGHRERMPLDASGNVEWSRLPSR